MSKKRKNIIDVKEAIQIFDEGFDLNARCMNEYQIRVDAYEDTGFFDWYHTTGKLVHNKSGGCKGVDKKFLRPEQVAIFIIKNS